MSKLLLITLIMSAYYISINNATLYSEKDNVVHLTEDNFEERVMDNPAMWIVQFYDDERGENRRFAQKYTEVADVLKGVINVGVVDVTRNRNWTEQYNIKEYPTIMFFGFNKSTPVDYDGPKSVQDIVNQAINFSKKKGSDGREKIIGSVDTSNYRTEKRKEEVVTLNELNFDDKVMGTNVPWLIEFYSPRCRYCKRLSNEWVERKSEFKRHINLGSVDATVNKRKAKEFEVLSYPTVKFLHQGIVDTYRFDWNDTDIYKFVNQKLMRHDPSEL